MEHLAVDAVHEAFVEEHGHVEAFFLTSSEEKKNISGHDFQLMNEIQSLYLTLLLKCYNNVPVQKRSDEEEVQVV
jgi:hypothetical protein